MQSCSTQNKSVQCRNKKSKHFEIHVLSIIFLLNILGTNRFCNNLWMLVSRLVSITCLVLLQNCFCNIWRNCLKLISQSTFWVKQYRYIHTSFYKIKSKIIRVFIIKQVLKCLENMFNETYRYKRTVEHIFR